MNVEAKDERAAEDLPDTGSIEVSKTQAQRELRTQAKATIRVEHLDIIKDDFWEQRPWLLSSKVARLNTKP